MTQNKSNTRLPRAYLIFTAAAALAAAALQLVLLFCDYDFTLGLYESGSVTATIFKVFMFIAVIAVLTLVFTGAKLKMPPALPKVGRGVTFTAAMTGFAVVATVVLQLFLGLSFETSLTGWKAIFAQVLNVLMLAFSLPASAYFIVMAVRRDPYRRSTAALGFFPVLWAAAYLMCVYFDSSTTLNNPLRIIEQVALIAAMAFLLMELRYLIGQPKPALYLAFGMAAIILIAASSLPTLVLTLMMKLSVSVDTVYDTAKLCLLAYIASRLVSVLRDPAVN